MVDARLKPKSSAIPSPLWNELRNNLHCSIRRTARYAARLRSSRVYRSDIFGIWPPSRVSAVMPGAAARRAVASVGALSSAVGGVGTGGSTRALASPNALVGARADRRTASIPLMPVALGAAATATALRGGAIAREAGNSRGEAKPRANPEGRNPRPAQPSQAAAAVAKKETEKSGNREEGTGEERTGEEGTGEEVKLAARPRRQNPTPISSTPTLLTQRRIFLNGRVDDKQRRYTLGWKDAIPGRESGPDEARS